MKLIQRFPRQLHDFLRRDFGAMRPRIHTAILPCTCRNHSRKHYRIPSLNRKGCRLPFGIAMTCGMSRKHRLFQGFLATFLNRGIA